MPKVQVLFLNKETLKSQVHMLHCLVIWDLVEPRFSSIMFVILKVIWSTNTILFYMCACGMWELEMFHHHLTITQVGIGPDSLLCHVTQSWAATAASPQLSQNPMLFFLFLQCSANYLSVCHDFFPLGPMLMLSLDAYVGPFWECGQWTSSAAGGFAHWWYWC